MQTPPLQAWVNAVTARVVGPVSAGFAAVVQSTWNFQSCSALGPRLTRKFGDPAGGGVVPSRSDGNRLSKSAPTCTHCAVAGRPLSIAARSSAHTIAPSDVFPENRLVER